MFMFSAFIIMKIALQFKTFHKKNVFFLLSVSRMEYVCMHVLKKRNVSSTCHFPHFDLQQLCDSIRTSFKNAILFSNYICKKGI
jgi:hypothetical protein